MANGYQLVRLNNGICSVRSLVDEETFHPVIGPAAEAESLYVHQLRLRERLAKADGEFVVWDVGLGAAANTIAVLRAAREISGQLRIISFDHTSEPLEFALKHSAELGYFDGYEIHAAELLRNNSVVFENGKSKVNWQFQGGDFPAFLSGSSRRESALISKPANLSGLTSAATKFPPPHAILFDAYSPARNPAMWTLPLFTNLFQALDPQRPCAMPTHSRSTILRVTLLLAGFYVGVGHATGEKEETTIAANDLSLLSEPLDLRWLDRARRSHRAEPMVEPVYKIAPLSPENWERLQAHPQFQL